VTDKEYRELYEKTEHARLGWDAAMLNFCQVKYLHEIFSSNVCLWVDSVLQT